MLLLQVVLASVAQLKCRKKFFYAETKANQTKYTISRAASSSPKEGNETTIPTAICGDYEIMRRRGDRVRIGDSVSNVK